MKDETVFVCANCGEESLEWLGKCQNCGQWNTLREMKISRNKEQGTRSNGKPAEIRSLDKIASRKLSRLSTGIAEFDRVLGAGIVPGSVILLAGDPGIGKSTLLLQIAAKQKQKILYVSGEESAYQLRLRADRLKIKGQQILLLAETEISKIIDAAVKEEPALIIIDSIQTIFSPDFPSTPGSLVQVRESALRLQQIAKTSGIPIILVGHVTKEGGVAGPKTLEHMVDVVLYLEGERYHGTRILRGIKNRYGATDEIGIFEMMEEGMAELKNPSQAFLQGRVKNVPGSVVTATLEGTRPLLVEIQALTTKTFFPYPRRTSVGFDLNRLYLLTAVLQRRAGIRLDDQDIFLNVAGGMKISEPAVDLAVLLAIASAAKSKAIDPETCCFGEVGLSGEIRQVSQRDKRIKEARRLGFGNIIETKTISQAIKKTIGE